MATNSFDTKQLLHQASFTPKNLYKKQFYTKHLTRNSFCQNTSSLFLLKPLQSNKKVVFLFDSCLVDLTSTPAFANYIPQPWDMVRHRLQKPRLRVSQSGRCVVCSYGARWAEASRRCLLHHEQQWQRDRGVCFNHLCTTIVLMERASFLRKTGTPRFVWKMTQPTARSYLSPLS